MSFFSRIKGLFSDAAPKAAAGGLLSSTILSGTAPRRGTRELLQAYRTNPWWHAATHKISGAVAETHFELFRARPAAGAQRRFEKGAVNYAPADAQPVAQHPLLTLLEAPCPAFTRAVWQHLVQAYIDTKGYAILVVERSKSGEPVELWPVPPHWLAETPHRNFPFYRFSFGAWQRTISEDDVLLVRHPDLEQPYVLGVGFGEALADELDIDEFAAKHLKDWFFNRALPDAFLSVEGLSGADEAQRYEEKLRQKNGLRGKGYQLHVTGGKVTVQELSHTFREQMLPELRTGSRDTVLQTLGVPPEIMGIVENSNRATIDAAVVIFTRFTTTPRLTFLADAFTQWGRMEWDDAALFVGFSSPVPSDATFQLQVMTAQPDLFTKNEWRELAGLPKVAGWDDEFQARPSVALPMATPALPAGDEPDEPEKPDEPEDEEEQRGLLRLVGSLGIDGR